MPILLAVEGPSAGVRFRVDDEADVGRASACRIRIHDGKMSRRHALFRCERDVVRVADLGSRNGTFVNERRIEAPVVLAAGDKVRIGGTIFIFEPALDVLPSRFTGGAVVLDDGGVRLDEEARVDGGAADPDDLLARLATRLAAAPDVAAILTGASEVVTLGLRAHAGGVLVAGGGRPAVPAALVGASDLFLTSGWVSRVLEDGHARLGRLVHDGRERLVMTAPVGERRGRGLLHVEGKPKAAWTGADLSRLAACGRLLDLALRRATSAPAGDPWQVPELVGGSPAMRALRRSAEALVESEAPLLLEGERGSGRAHLARWLHARSPRAAGPFVVLRTEGADPTGLAVRLFGREYAAASGDRYEQGALERADGGTLYVDGLDGLPAGLQARLARSLGERAFVREGGRQAVSVDVRLVGSRAPLSEGGLRREVSRAFGRRRLEVPPLREREGDLAPLFEHFARLAARDLGRSPIELAPEAVAGAERYPWPGNLAELDLVVRRLARIRPSGAEIDVVDLPQPRGRAVVPAGASLARQIAALEAAEIERVLEEEGGRKIHAARRLGLSRPTLDRKIALYGIKVGR